MLQAKRQGGGGGGGGRSARGAASKKVRLRRSRWRRYERWRCARRSTVCRKPTLLREEVAALKACLSKQTNGDSQICRPEVRNAPSTAVEPAIKNNVKQPIRFVLYNTQIDCVWAMKQVAVEAPSPFELSTTMLQFIIRNCYRHWCCVCCCSSVCHG